MVDNKQPSKAIFNRLGSDKPGEFRHLQPLSVYSRTITCDAPNAGLGDGMYCNIKVEIFNNSSVSGGRKRQLDDSCLDETYETPQKKPCLSVCHSPDLACVLDSPLLGDKNGAAEYSIVEEKATNVVNDNINKSTDTENTSKPEGPPLVHQPPCLVLTDGSNESDRLLLPCSDIQLSSPLTHNSEKIGHVGSAFVIERNELRTLSPIGCYEGLPDSDGWKDFPQSSFHKHQSSEQPPGKVEGHEGARNTVSENDEGYSTKSKNVTLADIVTPVMSTPLDKFRHLVKRSPILNRLEKLGQPLSPLNLSLEPENASSPISLYGSMNLDGMNAETDREIPVLDSNENIESKVRSVDAAIQKSLVCHKGKQVPVVTASVKQEKEAKIVPSLRAPVVTASVKQEKEDKIVPSLRAPVVTASVKQEKEAKIVPSLRAPVVTASVKQEKQDKIVPSLRAPVVTASVKQEKEAKIVPSLRGPVVTASVKQEKQDKIVPSLRAPVVTVKEVKDVKVVADTVKQVKEAKDVPPVIQQVNPKLKVTICKDEHPSVTLENAAALQVRSKVVPFSIQRRDEKVKSAVKPPAAAFASPSNTTTSSQQPERKSQSDYKRKVHGDVQRTVVFHSEEDWEREKKVYVDSVVRHMQDNQGNGNGVMNELFNLMDTVASQGNQREGQSWQHPSDLTRRNYQPHNGGSSLSLIEWQNQNYRFHRRFAQVPNPFKRSPLP